MTLDQKFAFISDIVDETEDSLENLYELSGSELLELQEIADKITEALTIVMTTRHLIAQENKNEQNI